MQRQEEDCRDLATRVGAQIVAVESDNSISAYSGRARPGFAAVLAAVREGRADTVLVWHQDRWARSARDLAALLDLRSVCPDLALIPVRGTPIYAGDASGRMVAEIVASVAHHESAQKAERVARQRRQAVERGDLPAKVYGYDPVTGGPVEPAAAGVRAAYAAFLATQNVAAARAALVAADPAAPASRNAVRGLLTRAAYAGIAQYQGAERPEIETTWEPLVSAEDYRLAQAILTRPARRHAKHDRGARTALLTSLVTCGRCGEPMVASTQHGGAGGRRYPVYACAVGNEHLRRRARPVEAYVVAAVMARLGQPDAQATVLPREVGPGAADLAQQWAEVTARRSAVADAFAGGLMAATDYQRTYGGLSADVAALEDRLAEVQVHPESGRAMPADPAYALVGCSLAGLRQVISTLAEVTLNPAGRGRQPFRPETVRITWRTSLPADPPASGLAAAARPPETWWEEVQELVDGGSGQAAEDFVAATTPPALSPEQRRALWAALAPAADGAADAEV